MLLGFLAQASWEKIDFSSHLVSGSTDRDDMIRDESHSYERTEILRAGVSGNKKVRCGTLFKLLPHTLTVS